MGISKLDRTYNLRLPETQYAAIKGLADGSGESINATMLGLIQAGLETRAAGADRALRTRVAKELIDQLRAAI